MNVVDTTPPSQTHTISFEFDLRHPPAKVWRGITDPVLLAEWLLPIVELKLEPGATFMFRTQPHPGWDGSVHCKVLEVDAPRRLRYAWVVGDMVLDTVVTFTLTETPTGTRLGLEQTGFKADQKQNFGGARYGWNMMGNKLVELLDRA